MRKLPFLTAAFLSCSFPVLLAEPIYTSPEAAADDPSFGRQGEYTGVIASDDAPKAIGVQVIALGNDAYRAVAYWEGLPGAGWDGEEPLQIEGKMDGGKIEFRGKEGMVQGTLADGVLAVSYEGTPVGTLKKTLRESPTMGKKAPEGATVLFDGESTDAWKGGKLTGDGFLAQGTQSKETFGDAKLHIEFRTPFKPEARGQKRGNSGLYIQGRYEVQVLDSFGLDGKNNECGGIYSVAEPRENMCFPPLSWQTYDIDFTAAKFDGAGKKTAEAQVTVRHNGVVIHKEVSIPGPTAAAPDKGETGNGPVFLQNHGNPVSYRNIWVLPR